MKLGVPTAYHAKAHMTMMMMIAYEIANDALVSVVCGSNSLAIISDQRY